VQFNEYRGVEEDTRDGESTGLAPGDPSKGGGVSSGAPGQRTRESIRSSGLVKEFVLVYEAEPHSRSRKNIRISGCPAKNYYQAFKHVDKAVDENGTIGPRYIYWGNYIHHVVSKGLKGVSVYFNCLAIDGKALGVWVPSELGPPKMHQDLMNRLQRAQQFSDAKIYVLGTFKLFEDWKYTIEITRLSQLWIYFPDDLTSAAVTYCYPFGL
jgi:hypothetical protein